MVYISRKERVKLLRTKEHLNNSLFRATSTHLLQVASESAHGLYIIKRTVFTNKKAVPLKFPTHLYHLLERWMDDFRLIRIGIGTYFFNVYR